MSRHGVLPEERLSVAGVDVSLCVFVFVCFGDASVVSPVFFFTQVACLCFSFFCVFSPPRLFRARMYVKTGFGLREVAADVQSPSSKQAKELWEMDGMVRDAVTATLPEERERHNCLVAGSASGRQSNDVEEQRRVSLV